MTPPPPPLPGPQTHAFQHRPLGGGGASYCLRDSSHWRPKVQQLSLHFGGEAPVHPRPLDPQKFHRPLHLHRTQLSTIRRSYFSPSYL